MGDIAEVRARGQIHRCRELGQEVIRKIEVQIKAGQIARLLLLDLLDLEFWEDHTPFWMVGMWEWEKPLRP
jgi:hypothetical protein